MEPNEERVNKVRKRLPNIFVYIFGGFFVLLFFSLIGLFVYDVVQPGRTIEKCTDINEYEKYIEEVNSASELMPSLDDLSSYTDVRFGYKRVVYSSFLGCISDDISLFVTYEDNYNEEKEKALNSYDYLKEDEMINDYGEIQFPLMSFDYKGYTFQIVPNRHFYKSGHCTCQSFMMIGYNDDICTIVYLYYYDTDIDYLYDEKDTITREETMYKFIDDGFIWYE